MSLVFSSYRSAARFLNHFNYSNFLSPSLTFFLLLSCAFLSPPPFLSLFSFSLHFPPHFFLVLIITLYLSNPPVREHCCYGHFCSTCCRDCLLFFPGTRIGAAPWEARCCLERCRIRSHEGCLCGGSRWQSRAGNEWKSSPEKLNRPMFLPRRHLVHDHKQSLKF